MKTQNLKLNNINPNKEFKLLTPSSYVNFIDAKILFSQADIQQGALSKITNGRYLQFKLSLLVDNIQETEYSRIFPIRLDVNLSQIQPIFNLNRIVKNDSVKKGLPDTFFDTLSVALISPNNENEFEIKIDYSQEDTIEII